MNHDQYSTNDDNDNRDEVAIESLLSEVGPRAEPTPEMMHAVRAAVHSEWRTMVAQRVSHRRRVGWSIAASVVLAFGALLLFRISVPRSDAVPMASIIKVQSAISAGNVPSIVQVSASAGTSWRDVVAGEVLLTGSEVRTDSATRVALDLGKGLAVRIDSGTHLKMLAADRISLERGRIYVDSLPSAAAPLFVQTPFGAVNHLGTQYQVQVAQNRLTVSVREGRVAVVGGYGKAQIAANESATYTEQGEIARTAIASQDPSWLWAMQTSPTYAIDNRSLASFLDWVARETGRTVVYASPQAQIQAEQLVLRGSVDKLSPDQALQAVLATTQFVHTDTASVIQVGLRAK